jgi:hypothetical protein
MADEMRRAHETLEQMMGWAQDNSGPIKHHYDIAQHSDAWHALRCGTITASGMKNLVSKKKGEWVVPDTDTMNAYLFELAGQRMAKDDDNDFQSHDMMRGIRDEADAFNLYSEKYEQLRTCGFITNDEHGVLIGFSPDGLTALNDDGFIECKSRKQKFQAETFYRDEVPEEYVLQIQTGLLVTRRKWCDYLQYCGGMKMYRKRVYPDPALHEIIIAAARSAEAKISEIVAVSESNSASFYPTIKRVEDIQA